MADPHRLDPHPPDPHRPDPLVAELAALGRALDVPPPPDDLAAAVLARVPAHPPRPSALRRFAAGVAARATRGRRIALAVLLAVALALAVGTPAAAGIARWLGLGGVVVVETPHGPGPAAPPGAPAGEGPSLSVREAGELAGFVPLLPAALGPPDRISVAADAPVVGADWAPTTPRAPGLHLDQFVGGPGPYFVKRYHDVVELVEVDGAEALWLPQPHSLEYLDAIGHERTAPSRTSGPALIWQRGELTLRLEGEPDRARAVQIAESVR
jgi:hypothetical protein